MTDQTTETARALLYRHGLPEDVIDGALCLHAQELAAEREALWNELHRRDNEVDQPHVADQPAPAVWIDGHPQLEAIAAAVWERCRTEGTSVVVDDPRNIAVAALAAVLPATTNHDTDTNAALREAANRMSRKATALTEDLHDLAHFVAKDRLREAEILDREAAELRRVADETAATETQAAAWGVCQDCGAAAGPDCDCPPLAEQPAAGARQDGTQQ